jgi:hypothetical protein
MMVDLSMMSLQTFCLAVFDEFLLASGFSFRSGASDSSVSFACASSQIFLVLLLNMMEMFSSFSQDLANTFFVCLSGFSMANNSSNVLSGSVDMLFEDSLCMFSG